MEERTSETLIEELAAAGRASQGANAPVFSCDATLDRLRANFLVDAGFGGYPVQSPTD